MFQIRKISYDYAGGWFIIHYSLLQSIQKVAVGGSILAICLCNKVVLFLWEQTITFIIRLEAIVSQCVP